MFAYNRVCADEYLVREKGNTLLKFRIIGLAAVVVVLAASCGSAAELEPAAQLAAIEDRTEATSADDGGSDQGPVPDVALWPVGPKFTASTVVIDGVAVEHSMWLQSVADGSVSIDFGACGFGGTATASTNGDRLILGEFDQEDAGCDDQSDDLVATAGTVEELFVTQPVLTVTDDTITVENEQVHVVLITDDPTANLPPAPTGVWFQALTATNPVIDPAGVSLIVHAFFVIDVQLETCLVHTSVGSLDTADRRDVITAVKPGDCPDPSTSDQAVLDLLNTKPVVTHDSGLVTLTGTDDASIILTTTDSEPGGPRNSCGQPTGVGIAAEEYLDLSEQQAKTQAADAGLTVIIECSDGQTMLDVRPANINHDRLWLTIDGGTVAAAYRL